jgi:hypothetical protein
MFIYNHISPIGDNLGIAPPRTFLPPPPKYINSNILPVSIDNSTEGSKNENEIEQNETNKNGNNVKIENENNVKIENENEKKLNLNEDEDEDWGDFGSAASIV